MMIGAVVIACAALLASQVYGALTTCTTLQGGLSASCGGVKYSIGTMQPSATQ